MNIVLSGMPGCGKTTVSEILAKKLGFEAVDTDALIEEEHGEISTIFAEHGESYFRNLETEAVKRVAALDGAVIATGGGCLLRPENVELLKTSGKIFYLKTEVAELVDRLKGDGTRPLLQGGLEKRLKKLYAERAGVYERAADYVVGAAGLSADGVAQKITELIL